MGVIDYQYPDCQTDLRKVNPHEEGDSEGETRIAKNTIAEKKPKNTIQEKKYNITQVRRLTRQCWRRGEGRRKLSLECAAKWFVNKISPQIVNIIEIKCVYSTAQMLQSQCTIAPQFYIHPRCLNFQADHLDITMIDDDSDEKQEKAIITKSDALDVFA